VEYILLGYTLLGLYTALNIIIAYLIASYIDHMRLKGYTFKTIQINIKIKYVPLVVFLPAFVFVGLIMLIMYVCINLSKLVSHLFYNTEKSFVNKSIFKRNIDS